jgi:hypothetical protein
VVEDRCVSRWAEERFGSAAADLVLTVPLAIQRAHQRAMAAHAAGGLETNEAYGSTLHAAQYEELVSLSRLIDGVAIRKPVSVQTGPVKLVIIDETAVVLYPWRYAKDRSKPRDKAKFDPPVSDLRKMLLTLAARPIDPQLTLDDADRDYEELEAEWAEELAILEQLRRFGQVVTIGYASNPSGLFDLGWGDLELLNEDSGEVVWQHWEPLLGDDQAEEGGARVPRGPERPPGDAARARRFDDAPLIEDFGLAPRPPLSGTPISEPERNQPETRSDDPE